MEFTDLVPMIESLDDNIDDLEVALEPLHKSPLSDTAGKLPLLDKAQLYVLTTYAIESILFSYLRLNGVNSKEHPVFRELTRVKQYFEKIKAAESSGSRRNVALDKQAAGRFIKHALAGNKELDLDHGKQSDKDNAASHVRFEESPRPRNRSRTVSSDGNPDYWEHMESPDAPSLKRTRGQRSSGRRENDEERKAKAKREMNPSSATSSKTSAPSGDVKAGLKEEMGEKRRKPEGSQGNPDED